MYHAMYQHSVLKGTRSGVREFPGHHRPVPPHHPGPHRSPHPSSVRFQLLCAMPINHNWSPVFLFGANDKEKEKAVNNNSDTAKGSVIQEKAGESQSITLHCTGKTLECGAH